jgi:hypothetical protein
LLKGLGQELLDRWPELASIAAVGSTRQDYGDLGGKVSVAGRYFIISRGDSLGWRACSAASAVRGSWTG